MRIASIVEFDYEEITNEETWEEALNALMIDLEVPFRVTVTKEISDSVDVEDYAGSWYKIINQVFDGLELPYTAELDVEDPHKIRIVIFEGTSMVSYSAHLEKLDGWLN